MDSLPSVQLYLHCSCESKNANQQANPRVGLLRRIHISGVPMVALIVNIILAVAAVGSAILALFSVRMLARQVEMQNEQTRSLSDQVRIQNEQTTEVAKQTQLQAE